MYNLLVYYNQKPMKSLYYCTLLLVCFTSSAFAQIVSLDPAFPKRDETVTITYDATQGNGGLTDVSQVYLHTGLITSESNSPSDWKFVVGNWGTDDPRVKMTNIGNNKHQLSFIINDFYEVPTTTVIEQLAFVFRNLDGSKEGKTATLGDIFLNYNESSEFTAQLLAPTQNSLIVNTGESVNIKFVASEVSDIIMKDNGIVFYQELTNNVDYAYIVPDNNKHVIDISAEKDGMIQEASFSLVVNPDVITETYPLGTELGINKINDTDYRLVLFAPNKSNAYVLGDFNDWEVDPEYFMRRSPDGQSFWIDITGLEADKNYAFQYLVDGNIVIADPFSELVLDPNNDQWIDESTFPDLHPYPAGKTNGYASLLKTQSEEYVWENEFTAPLKEDLVIYELLMRDFTSEKNYQTLLDTLDYLDRLGINAIEFMPINEFEGNDSWGYNPSFHMALDKYYGTPESFKRLVDECHKREIAVILDVVYNHAFSQSPLARLYWDAGNFRPSADSPFLNVVAKHPFNVGYDFNHESNATQTFVNRVTKYWLDEYHVDGFRFDLSKGFTQTESTNDGTFRAYDQGRIDVLKLYADHIWTTNSDAYVILEHFAANDEEEELSDYGMMLWSNHNHNFNEATMGYNSGGKSNFEWIDYKKKGWSNPYAVGYMESHDEERLMYKNGEFGNANGNYSTKDKATGLDRVEMATAFFYSFPGPKMIWQFGEMGYDFSINRCENGSISNDCRLSPKPIRWDYKSDIDRKRLIDVTSAMIKLKLDTDLMNSTTYSHNVIASRKFIKLHTAILDALVVGNFDVIEQTIDLDFDHTGTWYDYLEGGSIDVNNTAKSITLGPGEYHVYLDKIVDSGIISGIEDIDNQINNFKLFPNPASDFVSVEINLNKSSESTIQIFDLSSKMVYKQNQYIRKGTNKINLDISKLSTGLYHIVIEGKGFSIIDRLVVNN
ncbi:MAG: hypothetical protein ACJA1A_001604 [Saprospiraceae bacterium]|jgi:hypothetical protein